MIPPHPKIGLVKMLQAPSVCSVQQRRMAVRAFSSKNAPFRTRRRPNPNYRPLAKPRKQFRDNAKGNNHRFIELGSTIDRATLEKSFGPMGDAAIQSIRRDREREMNEGVTYDDKVEEGLRMVDYYLAPEGTLEDRVGQRRALELDEPSIEEREKYLAELDAFVKQEHLREMDLDKASLMEEDTIGAPASLRLSDGDDEFNRNDEDPEVSFDPNQLAHGEWSEMLINVSRTIKLWRGGRLESYRALVIGGNLVRWLLALRLQLSLCFRFERMVAAGSVLARVLIHWRLLQKLLE